MWNKISDIPVWYAEYLEAISLMEIEQISITDANDIWDLLMR
jgi:hypothetical protein